MGGSAGCILAKYRLIVRMLLSSHVKASNAEQRSFVQTNFFGGISGQRQSGTCITTLQVLNCLVVQAWMPSVPSWAGQAQEWHSSLPLWQRQQNVFCPH
jgi:hypothetical protein